MKRQQSVTVRRIVFAATIIKTSMHLPMVAMFLTAVLARPAAAENQVPFKGQSSGVITTVRFDPEALVVYTHVEGEGRATHLGRFTVTGDVAVDVVTGIAQGPWTLTSANGDMLLLELVGDGIDPTHGFGTFTVVGGAGRFQGATGSWEQSITFSADPSTQPITLYSDVLEGTISSGLQ